MELKENSDKSKLQTWLNLLGPIIVGLVTGICCVVAAYISQTEVIMYETREMPYFDEINTTEYFPLKNGNKWTYQGTVIIPIANSVPKTLKKKIEISMEVKDVIECEPDIMFFTMKGHPDDIISYWSKINENDKEPVKVPASRYGYLIISNKVYYIPERHFSETLKYINKQVHVPPITDENLCFEFPLFEGQRYGSAPNIGRTDLQYFWYVNNKSEYHATIDNNRIVTFPRYWLVYNTLPSYYTTSFEPYQGITSIEYRHHGTRIDAKIYLKECYLN